MLFIHKPKHLKYVQRCVKRIFNTKTLYFKELFTVQKI